VVLSPVTSLFGAATQVYKLRGILDIKAKFKEEPLQIVAVFGLVTFGIGFTVTTTILFTVQPLKLVAVMV
jgi:hypothetical protein